MSTAEKTVRNYANNFVKTVAAAAAAATTTVTRNHVTTYYFADGSYVTVAAGEVTAGE
jgi:hypothetical protein